MDFGEHLVELRDCYERPLPIRVRWWSLFLRISLETFCATALLLLRQPVKGGPLLFEQTLALQQEEIRALYNNFNELRADHPNVSPEQVAQAQAVLHQAMYRLEVRFMEEQRIMADTARSAIFVGTVTFGLITMTCLMSLGKGIRISLQWFDVLLICQLLGVVCLRFWQRKQ